MQWKVFNNDFRYSLSTVAQNGYIQVQLVLSNFQKLVKAKEVSVVCISYV